MTVLTECPEVLSDLCDGESMACTMFGCLSCLGVLSCCWFVGCLLQLFVRFQDKVFRDEVLWDVGNPMNNADNYAIRVCEDLGLACDWYDAIRAYVTSRLEEVKQVGYSSEFVFTLFPGDVCLHVLLGQCKCSGPGALWH